MAVWKFYRETEKRPEKQVQELMNAPIFLDPVLARDNVKTAGNYILEVNNKNIRKKCGICPKLAIKTPERRHFSQLVLVFLLLTLNRSMPPERGSIYLEEEDDNTLSANFSRLLRYLIIANVWLKT